jgi:hypothetical protein
MISDLAALQQLRQEWDGVRALRDRIKLGTATAAMYGGYPFILSDMAHNLPLLHACGVLSNVLQQLAVEKNFPYKGRDFGRLRSQSEHCLPWNDFALMKGILDRRNDLAHRGILVSPQDCQRYIEAIEHELVTWKIIDPV